MDRKSASSSRPKVLMVPGRSSGLRRSSSTRFSPETSFHWIFRSNIPKRRNLYLPKDVQKRNFFGLGEVVAVLANPSQTLKSLTEAKTLLEQTRNELTEARERAQITPMHTFSPLPPSLFFPRPAEVRAIENILKGEPSWTILFGASSTGKTAILRQVLSDTKYHVLHFDLRIAGFAELTSLYMSFSQQMEQYFMHISETMEGYGEFEREGWSFKHDRLNVERRLANGSVPANDSMSTIHALAQVKTGDIARLMEMFQSSLLKYRDFKPFEDVDTHSDTTEVNPGGDRAGGKLKAFWKRRKSKGKEMAPSLNEKANRIARGSEEPRHEKKVPVIFFDEAHKLPALIQSTGAMKCLLDAMLVLTKQDRLCHVIQATSEPFYQTWLRKANVMQHCKIITIGDCSKSETRAFFKERIIPNVPERLRSGLIFNQLYDAFGGKLAHWQDFVSDYVNANGKLDIRQSSHFLQAYALLNLHIIHSSGPSLDPAQKTNQTTNAPHQLGSVSTPNLLGSGFHIYSPLTPGMERDDDTATPDFTETQLVNIMNKLTERENGVRSLPYFQLCKEIGVKAVDGMVRGRILDLRWTDVVRRSNSPGLGKESASMSTAFRPRGGADQQGDVASLASEQDGHFHTATTVTMVNTNSAAIVDPEEGEIVPAASDAGASPIDGFQLVDHDVGEDDEPDDGFVGPKLLPATPIMRFAMREVVSDYLQDDSASEYASLSDVSEY